MYVDNTNILLLMYNVYNYDYSFAKTKINGHLLLSLKKPAISLST